MPTDLARDLLLGTANGLKALHDHGILHSRCEIRERNARQWRPSGVARPGRRATSERSDRYQLQSFWELFGRGAEWLFREECSTSSDVYSLGTIGYQLLTGQPIFSDIGLYSRLVMAVQNQPIEIEDSGWSPERRYLGNVVRRMLAKEPESRPSLDVVIECLSNYRRRDAWSWLERNGIFRKLGSDLGSDSPRQRRFVQAVLELYGEETLRRLMRENHTDQVVSDPRLRRMLLLIEHGRSRERLLVDASRRAQECGLRRSSEDYDDTHYAGAVQNSRGDQIFSTKCIRANPPKRSGRRSSRWLMLHEAEFDEEFDAAMLEGGGD